MNERVSRYFDDPSRDSSLYASPTCPAFERDWTQVIDNNKPVRDGNGIIVDEDNNVLARPFLFKTIDPQGWISKRKTGLTAWVKNPRNSCTVYGDIGIRSALIKVNEIVFAGDVTASGKLVISRPVLPKLQQLLFEKLESLEQTLEMGKIPLWENK